MNLKKNTICQVGLATRLADTELFENLQTGKNLPVFLVENQSKASALLKNFPAWEPKIWSYEMPVREEEWDLLKEDFKTFLKANKITACHFSLTDKEEQSFLEKKDYNSFPLYGELHNYGLLEQCFQEAAEEAGVKVVADSPRNYDELTGERAKELKQELIEKMNNLNNSSSLNNTSSTPNVRVERFFYQHLLQRLQTRNEREQQEIAETPKSSRNSKNKDLLDKIRDVAFSIGRKFRTQEISSQELHNDISNVIDMAGQIKKMPHHDQEKGMEYVRSAYAQVESAFYQGNTGKGMKRQLKNGVAILERHSLTAAEKRHREMAKKLQDKRNQLLAYQKAQERQAEADERKKAAAYEQHLNSVQAEQNLPDTEKAKREQEKAQRIKQNKEKHILKQQKKQEENQAREASLSPQERRMRHYKKMRTEQKAQKQKTAFQRLRGRQKNR